MRISFTGTKEGMTNRQKRAVELIIRNVMLAKRFDISFHHGDCIGADFDFHNIVESCAIRFKMRDKIDIIGHIPDNDSYRAFCKFDYERDPLPYLERNKNIVMDYPSIATMLIACPKILAEEMRSGTWATVRYARKHDVPIIVIDP